MIQLAIRNPSDGTTTFDQIEIQKGTLPDGSDMAALDTITIDTSTRSDLSPGYTQYIDSTGLVGVTYYRTRFSKFGDFSTVSSYTDIFLGGASIFHVRFRNRMKDKNPNNYYFQDDEITELLEETVDDLWPLTWQETYTDTLIVPDNTTEVFPFSVGMTRLNKIDVINTSGENVNTSVRYETRDNKIIFDEAPRTGVTYRAWIEKRFMNVYEVPSTWDSYILMKMRLKAYETMEGDRENFYKYNSIAKPEGGNLPSLDRTITRLEGQIKIRESQLRRSRRPAFQKMV